MSKFLQMQFKGKAEDRYRPCRTEIWKLEYIANVPLSHFYSWTILQILDAVVKIRERCETVREIENKLLDLRKVLVFKNTVFLWLVYKALDDLIKVVITANVLGLVCNGWELEAHGYMLDDIES